MLWLTINLAAAFLAASVVNQFSNTIAHLVSLAVLMPIVAGMGGNAGTQVLALMVRGLALGQIGGTNIGALVWKEVRIAIINGIGRIGFMNLGDPVAGNRRRDDEAATRVGAFSNTETGEQVGGFLNKAGSGHRALSSAPPAGGTAGMG